ncbi:MAG: hypothetical protein JSR59_26215 [Proteobacteria bacterium]|nr:hypothetical protein [Pseudomonadota bacterium]
MNQRYAWRALAACALGGALAVPASALGMNADVMHEYGGLYSSRCGDAAAPRLQVAADRLVIEVNGRTITGTQAQAAASYLGPEPGPDFRMALLADLRGGQGLVFIVRRDAAGQYIEIDGDPKLLAALAKSVGVRQYRDCDPARNRRVADQRAAEQRQQRAATAAAASDSTDPMSNRALKSAYVKALGALAKERWLVTMEGPRAEPRQVRVGGVDYLLFGACKPHDCADNNIVALYAAGQGVVYAKVLRQANQTAYLGAPPPAVVAELDRLWRAQWRQ